MDVMVTIPDGINPDGAIVELALVELYEDSDVTGWFTAEVRIPAPQDQP